MDEKFFIYYLADTQKYYYCAMDDKERMRRLNERMGSGFDTKAGGCCFSYGGWCTMAKNKKWMEYGERISPLDFSKISIIMEEEEEAVKIGTAGAKTEKLNEVKFLTQFEYISEICPKLADFLTDKLQCIEDVFCGKVETDARHVFLLYPNKDCAATFAAFIESDAIDENLKCANWVKIDDRFWLDLTFKEEK